MSFPKAPIVATKVTLPPMTVPDSIEEVFANDVTIQSRQGAVQVIFASIQAAQVDSKGNVTDRRVPQIMVALPLPVFTAFLECGRQLNVAMQQHETMVALATPATVN